MLPGETLLHVGPDEYLHKRCVLCGGMVWLLVQNGKITAAVPATCRCVIGKVEFEIAQDPNA